MEHTEAVRLQAAEKYLLGELTGAQRQEYEEHYFDCADCAEELKATVAFMESAKQVAREEATELVDNKQFVPAKGGWLAWLRPAFAVTALAAAALLVLVGYQNSVTIPDLRRGASGALTAQVVNSFSFMEVGARGGSGLPIKVRRDERYDLEIDFPPVTGATSYAGQIRDDSGRTVFTSQVSTEQAKSTVRVSIPAGLLRPGKYDFVILAATAADSQSAALKEIKRLPFTVEFQP